ncbi:formate dehydrogenase subunit delta [Pseudomonas sp. GX19020]|uniref:formate dehydrogenase subunit delta n=1 Tax=Pseudomonadota TaxID=1224 RepID=UPI00089846DE|nr:formate dehydrogenase subunit delta [Pseudomonas sp. GX19020]MCL4068741.1 formate dehydrogenase subunit delta [Pseudomonas sp. GX19020]SEB50008.1 formate dehydrogenase delta subunit [Rhodobacter sp. 24-YEA-8]
MQTDGINPKITRMANQIAMFMESKPEAEGIEGLSSHINDFWEPRMRRQFFQLIDAGGEGLRPLVIKASEKIRRPDPA